MGECRQNAGASPCEDAEQSLDRLSFNYPIRRSYQYESISSLARVPNGQVSRGPIRRADLDV